MTPPTVRFLTREWAEALDGAALASGALREAARGVELTIQQEVVPDGDDAGTPGRAGGDTADGDDTDTAVRYALRFADGEVRVLWGPVGAPDVTFVQDRSAAEAMSRGELNAQQAFVLGKLRVRGDVDRLVGAREAFALLEDTFADVRARTEY